MSEEVVDGDKPFQGPATVTLQDGTVVTLPRLTIGKIMAVTGAMSNLITAVKEKSPEVFEMLSGKEDQNIGVKMVQTLPQVFPVVLKEVVNVLSIYLNKDTKDIEENYDMEDLVAIAIPFFADITRQGSKVMGPLNDLMAKAKK